MLATFKPCNLSGNFNVPSSKSMAHRYLIGSALSKEVCVLSGIVYSEDILASILWQTKKICPYYGKYLENREIPLLSYWSGIMHCDIRMCVVFYRK